MSTGGGLRAGCSASAEFALALRTDTIGAMADVLHLTAILEREDDGYVALCPEYDVASQGATVEEARANLIEALTLFFESADAAEVERRFRPEVLITQIEVKVA